MKKILSFLFLLVVAFSLVACRDKGGDDNGGSTPAVRTYVADGKYTAFTHSLNYGKPQLTWVTVTIENDQIKSFYIDQLQSGAEGWNEKTKKELGYLYAMFPALGNPAEDLEGYKAALEAEGKLEWFQQAELIEKHFLTTLDVATDESGHIQGITGVTIADNDYIALAKKAVENAKAGIVTTFEAGKNQVAFATAKVDKDGKLSNVVLDVRQITNGAWREQTKQELGYLYAMFPALGNPAEDLEGYKAALKEAGKLEWFEQAALIVEGWLNGTITGEDITVVTGVTIKNSSYTNVLNALVADGWKK